MDNRSETREFLTSRRARIGPDEVGIPADAGRRVAGLRREEVAALAGISVEYYVRLERGNLRGVSDAVLDAVARALRLDDTEVAHLRNLAAEANASAASRARRGARPGGTAGVRPGVRHLLAGMTHVPAVVRNHRFDVLATNPLGRALYAPLFTTAPFTGTPNRARFLFLDGRARDFFVDWERVARDAVGALRVQAGRNPHDRVLSNLIGELATRSDEFRAWWDAHDVHVHRHATKRFRHPAIGEIELAAETMHLSDDTGQVLVAYSAEPGSAAEDGLRLLAACIPVAAETIGR